MKRAFIVLKHTLYSGINDSLPRLQNLGKHNTKKKKKQHHIGVIACILHSHLIAAQRRCDEKEHIASSTRKTRSVSLHQISFSFFFFFDLVRGKENTSARNERFKNGDFVKK